MDSCVPVRPDNNRATHHPLLFSLLFLSSPLRACCPFSALLLSARCQTFGDASPSCCLPSSSRARPFHWWRSVHGEKNTNNPFALSVTVDGGSTEHLLIGFSQPFCSFWPSLWSTDSLSLVQVVLCRHLGVWRLCRDLFCDIRLCGWHHTGAWEEYGVRFGKDLSQQKRTV